MCVHKTQTLHCPTCPGRVSDGALTPRCHPPPSTIDAALWPHEPSRYLPEPLWPALSPLPTPSHFINIVTFPQSKSEATTRSGGAPLLLEEVSTAYTRPWAPSGASPETALSPAAALARATLAFGQSCVCSRFTPLAPVTHLGNYAFLPPAWAPSLPSFLLFLLLPGCCISWRLLIISRSRKGISCSSWFLGLRFTFFSSFLRRTRA